jgi:hypothetical protein
MPDNPLTPQESSTFLLHTLPAGDAAAIRDALKKSLEAELQKRPLPETQTTLQREIKTAFHISIHFW